MSELPSRALWGGPLRAGAAKREITPEPGVSLDGPISKRGGIVTGVHDILHARAIVLSDGDVTCALIVCDACVIGDDVVQRAKDLIEQRSNIPSQHVLISATHTHAAVRATHIGTQPIDDAYHRFLADQIADAVDGSDAANATGPCGTCVVRKT